MPGHKITCCRCSEEPSQWEDTQELPKHRSETNAQGSIICVNLSYHISDITYGYSKGTQRSSISEATPMSSQTTCQSQCTLVGIKCTFVGTQRNRLDETTPTSSQSTCLNQCTGEPPLPVPPFHIWRQKSYVMGTRGNPLVRQTPRVPQKNMYKSMHKRRYINNCAGKFCDYCMI